MAETFDVPEAPAEEEWDDQYSEVLDEDYWDDYSNYDHRHWGSHAAPGKADSAMARMHLAASNVRNACAISVATLRSLDDESLENIYQVFENTSVMVMGQVEMIEKIKRERG